MKIQLYFIIEHRLPLCTVIGNGFMGHIRTSDKTDKLELDVV